MSVNFSETDLYEPINNYFTDKGYMVRSEVKGCDVIALKDDELIVIELKKSFNLKLIYQAIDRQKFSDTVYVAIPRPLKSQKAQEWKSMLTLIKRLDLGLITIALDSPIKTVEILVEPHSIKRKKNLIKEKLISDEARSRSKDLNKGGSTKTKVVTAYREKSIALACALTTTESLSLNEFKSFGFDNKTSTILRLNYYGWFEKIEKGVYSLSKKGMEEIYSPEYKQLVGYYSRAFLKTRF